MLGNRMFCSTVKRSVPSPYLRSDYSQRCGRCLSAKHVEHSHHHPGPRSTGHCSCVRVADRSSCRMHAIVMLGLWQGRVDWHKRALFCNVSKRVEVVGSDAAHRDADAHPEEARLITGCNTRGSVTRDQPHDLAGNGTAAGIGTIPFVVPASGDGCPAHRAEGTCHRKSRAHPANKQVRSGDS